MVTSTFVLHGGALTALGWGVMSLCVAAEALTDIDCCLAWQAWRWVRLTLALYGRRATYNTGLGLVAHLVSRYSDF